MVMSLDVPDSVAVSVINIVSISSTQLEFNTAVMKTDREQEQKKDEGEEVEDKKIVKKLSFSAALQGDMKVTTEDEELITAEEYAKQLDDVEVWSLLLQERIERLKTSEKYKDTFGGRLMRDIGAKLMQPGRMSVLSMEEEEARVKATWKDFDVVLWLAAFGSEEELEKFVGCPSKFIEDRTEVVVGFSDQIPVWVKIGRKKEVFCEREVKPRLESKDFLKMQKEKMKEEIKKELEGKGKANEEEEKPVEDCKPDEEEKEKVEDCKPDEEEKKPVEDCKPDGEEKKGVEDCKPGRDEDEDEDEEDHAGRAEL